MRTYIIIIVLLLLLFYYLSYSSEKFISFMASLSEYGPQPMIVFTKYVPNSNSAGKMNYPEIDPFTKSLKVLEIFDNQTYKTYSDDGFVREDMVPDYLWGYIKYLVRIAPRYMDRSFCQCQGNNMTQYYMIVNGITINMGIFGEGCTPVDLYPAKKIFFDLML